MPEGPEIWFLSKMINIFYSNKNTISVGKHLIIKDLKENWSFGLNGKVNINTSNELVKINDGFINGDKVKYDDYKESIQMLGIDWMFATKEELETEIAKWSKMKNKLAGLLLDQSKICGIGVAWGSEILFKANMRPDGKACEQLLDKQLLDKLVISIIETREKIQDIYSVELNKIMKDCKIYRNNDSIYRSNDKLKDFINEWFENLYEIRKTDIYKKGSKLQVLGRNWWII
jgi:formamidopyrimidine-DNA glycosylase